MSPRIVRTVFAVLALGLAVHAVHALIGPGDGPLDHAIASWVYTGLMWVGSWDAMTCDRGYRSAFTPEDAAAELRAHAGTQFDADVVVALLAVVFDADHAGASR